MKEWMKKANRTLLEMVTGILLFAAVCEIPCFFFPGYLAAYSAALWVGAATALFSTFHMYRTLDRGLDLPPEAAQKKIFIGYLTRYVIFMVVLVLSAMTDFLHPLVVFLGYMSLKVTAFIQPFTNKFYNYFFHEK